MHPLKNGSFRLIFLRVAAEFTGREKYKTPSRAHGCLRRAGTRDPGAVLTHVRMHSLKTAHFGSFFHVWPPSSPGREKYKTPSRAHGCLRRAGKREPSLPPRVGVLTHVRMHSLKNGSFRLIFLRVAAEFTGREKYKTPSRAHGCLRRAGKRDPGTMPSCC